MRCRALAKDHKKAAWVPRAQSTGLRVFTKNDENAAWVPLAKRRVIAGLTTGYSYQYSRDEESEEAEVEDNADYEEDAEGDALMRGVPIDEETINCTAGLRDMHLDERHEEKLGEDAEEELGEAPMNLDD
jgi:hypothetical protein